MNAILVELCYLLIDLFYLIKMMLVEKKKYEK